MNAELNEELPNTYSITKIIQEIANIVKYTFNITYDENSLSYGRFITHLKFFAQGMFNSTKSENTENCDLLELLKGKYNAEYECTERVSKFIEEKYNYRLTMDEKFYLTAHIIRVIDDGKLK